MKKVLLTVVLLLFLGANVVFSGTIDKIGYIDLQKIFELYSKKKPEVQEFYKKQEDFLKKKEKLEQEITDLQKDLQERGILYTEEVKNKKEQELNQKYLEYQNFLNEKGQELTERDNALTKAILEEIQKVIDQIGQENGYSVILPKTGILYGSPEMDLTDVLLEKLKLSEE